MIVELGPGDVDRVRALRLALGEHHASLATPPGYAVRAANEGALRFYARRGAVPAFTTLVQDLGPG